MNLKYLLMPMLLGAFMQSACAERSGTEGKGAEPAAEPGILQLENPGFEQTGDTSNVPAWSLFQHAGEASYEITIDRKSPGKGKQSLRMTQMHPQFYGLIEQQARTTPEMAGNTVELSALAKTSKMGDNGWMLWMYFFDSSEQLVAEYHSKPLVGTTKWQRIKVVGKVPSSAATVKLGMQMQDQGNHGIGWMDDVQLRLVETNADTQP